jgi:hypothetical protein
MATEYEAGRFSDLYGTPTGKRVWEFLNQPDTVARLLAASDVGKPAVAGLGTREELLGAIDEDVSSDRWKQTIGHMVRQVMEWNGRELATQGIKISIEGGESLFSKGSRYKRRLPHWGHLGMRGKSNGSVVYGSLGADDVGRAIRHIEGFATLCAERSVREGVINVRERGVPVSSKATRKIQIEASQRGSLADPQKERLRSAFGKGPVAPNVDIELTIG